MRSVFGPDIGCWPNGLCLKISTAIMDARLEGAKSVGQAIKLAKAVGLAPMTAPGAGE